MLVFNKAKSLVFCTYDMTLLRLLTDNTPSFPLGLNPLGDDLVLNCEEKPPTLVLLMELTGAPPYTDAFELYFVKSIEGCS